MMMLWHPWFLSLLSRSSDLSRQLAVNFRATKVKETTRARRSRRNLKSSGYHPLFGQRCPKKLKTNFCKKRERVKVSSKVSVVVADVVEEVAQTSDVNMKKLRQI
jgi:hypothetical protein